MEITSATTSKTNYVKGLTDEEDEELEEEQVEEEDTAVEDEQATDMVSFSSTDFDDSTVEEKARNYVQNILSAANLTDESRTKLQQYINTFDVESFIEDYGPFESVRDISAAMYAVTSGMIKYRNDDE